MRMYCANVRASEPVSIFWPATDFVGRATFFRPAAFASPAIAFGVMSGVPTTSSLPRFERTVSRPLTPMTIDAAPKTIKTTAAAIPPYVQSFLITSS